MRIGRGQCANDNEVFMIPSNDALQRGVLITLSDPSTTVDHGATSAMHKVTEVVSRCGANLRTCFVENLDNLLVELFHVEGSERALTGLGELARTELAELHPIWQRTATFETPARPSHLILAHACDEHGILCDLSEVVERCGADLVRAMGARCHARAAKVDVAAVGIEVDATRGRSRRDLESELQDLGRARGWSVALIPQEQFTAVQQVRRMSRIAVPDTCVPAPPEPRRASMRLVALKSCEADSSGGSVHSIYERREASGRAVRGSKAERKSTPYEHPFAGFAQMG